MIIDTRTIDSMIVSLTLCLGITKDTLFKFIDIMANETYVDKKIFNDNLFEEELLTTFSNLQSIDLIDEVYVYHLTRRLNDSIEDKSSNNLKYFLLNKSSISSFLLEYKISFVEQNDHQVIIYDNKEILLDNTSEPCYLRNRLGYNLDCTVYCFNGFMIRNNLMNNLYGRPLSKRPKFPSTLSRYFSIKNLMKSYYVGTDPKVIK